MNRKIINGMRGEAYLIDKKKRIDIDKSMLDTKVVILSELL